MKRPFYKKCETFTALILVLIILVFFAATFIIEGQYIFVASARDAKKEYTEENTVFENAKIFIKTFEDTFSESVFKRSSITPYASKINSVLLNGKTIDSPDVTLGKEDWLFYTTTTDGQPLIDYAGNDYFSEEKMSAITQNVEANRQKLEELGIEFAVMVVPNKEQIYSEYMPDTVHRFSEVSRSDVLLDYISKNSNVNVINPKQELLELKDEYPLYYKYDSHWTDIGAFTAYSQMTKLFFEEGESLEGREITVTADTNRYHADLIKMTGLGSWFGYDNYYEVSYEKEEPYDKTILFVGDSCREALEKYIKKGFENSVVIHRNDYTPELIEQIKPDIVVLEFAERYSEKMGDIVL